MRKRRSTTGRFQLESLEQRCLLSTFVVDLNGDADDGNYSQGHLTLREAVSLTNARNGHDTIRFGGSLAGATIETTGLTISDHLWIYGPGSDRLTIDLVAPGARIRIDSGSGALVAGLRIDNSRHLPSSGGIWTTRSLILRDVWISNSTLGAVWSESHLLIERSVLTANTTTGNGGAIFASGTLEVRQSTITDNSAVGHGGAIYRIGSDTETLEISGSLLARNTAGLDGGALWASGRVVVINSTLSANVSNGSGGAIAIDGGRASIRFSTLAHNMADADASGAGDGGAVALLAGHAPMLFTTDSLYAQNTVANLPGTLVLTGDSRLDPASGYNLLDSTIGTAGIVAGQLGNLVGLDAGIGPLADLGGPTLVHPITPDSPANGAAGGSIRTDQRIVVRTAAHADIGAYERQSLSTRGGTNLRVVSNIDGDNSIVMRNVDGAWIVFSGRDEEWSSAFLGEETDPAPTDDAVTWFDADDRITVAGPTVSGLLVFVRDADEHWTSRNIASELGVVADSPVRALATIRTPTGLMIVAGYNASDEIVAFQEIVDGGTRTWSFVNISDDLAAQGMATPALDALVGFATPWNAWNLAGINSTGNIQAVWIHLGSFSRWRADDVSTITGAGPLTAGTLTVTQTAWKAINLAGLDADGNLMVTWWAPGAPWTTSNLSAESGVPRLDGDRLTGFVTPWGAIHYVGFGEGTSGSLHSIWWTRTNEWTSRHLPRPYPERAGPLTSNAASDGTISILGMEDDGRITRTWWNPEGLWEVDNISELAG